MPNPRTPSAKAAITGADKKNPQRFQGRAKPKTPKLGAPSPFLNEYGQMAWESFKKEIPWLGECHRAHVEIAAHIRGRLLKGEDVGVQALNLLRQSIGQMGGNPSDMSKVFDAGDEEEKDPLAGYFEN